MKKLLLFGSLALLSGCTFKVTKGLSGEYCTPCLEVGSPKAAGGVGIVWYPGTK